MMEKFKALAWHIQLIALVAAASIIYFGVYWFITGETRAETLVLDDQVAQLKSQNDAAKLATQHIGEFRARFETVSAEYDELKVLLPEEREITNVLQGLQDSANDSRLIVNRFSPRDDSQQEFIMAKPVEIEVDSNFNNLRAFFDKMAKLQRIVSITDFKLNQLDKQSPNKTLHAQFLLTAYYAAPENLINAAAAAKTPGAPGAAGVVPPVPGAVPPAPGQTAVVPPAAVPPAAVPPPVAQ